MNIKFIDANPSMLSIKFIEFIRVRTHKTVKIKFRLLEKFKLNIFSILITSSSKYTGILTNKN